jgi:hypothetical protein
MRQGYVQVVCAAAWKQFLLHSTMVALRQHWAAMNDFSLIRLALSGLLLCAVLALLAVASQT